MAHFAQLDDTNTVLRVIVVSNINAPDPAPIKSEPLGQAFIASLGIPGRWVQTSYRASFRRRYAGPGMTYSDEHEAFILPQPYPSWTLDLDNPDDWVAPVPMPDPDGCENGWQWNEEGQNWECETTDSA